MALTIAFLIAFTLIAGYNYIGLPNEDNDSILVIPFTRRTLLRSGSEHPPQRLFVFGRIWSICHTKCFSDDDCESSDVCRMKCCTPSEEPKEPQQLPEEEEDDEGPLSPEEVLSFRSDNSSSTPTSSSSPRFLADDKDTLYGSYINGPFKGQQTPFAWPQSYEPCTYPNEDSDTPYKACAVDPGFLNRIMAFFSFYQELQIELDDNGMRGVMKSGSALKSVLGDSILFYPAGRKSNKPCLPPPDVYSESNGGYGVRLVRSGRYLHHWYFQSLTCDSSSVRMELKVTSDCLEVYLISDDGSQVQWMVNDVSKASSSNGYAPLSYCVQCEERTNVTDTYSNCKLVEIPVQTDCCMLGYQMCGPSGPSTECSEPIVTRDSTDLSFTLDEVNNNWMEGQATLPIRRFYHFALDGTISYMCVGNSTHSGQDLVSVWPPVGTILTSSCLTNVGITELVATSEFGASPTHDASCADGSIALFLPVEFVNRGFDNADDVGTSSSFDGQCSISVAYANVPPSRLRKRTVRGDGHTTMVIVPNYERNILVNENVTVRVTNQAMASATDSGWRKFKFAFLIDDPAGITGIGAFLQDPDTHLPLGAHVQLSKNWHSKPDDPQLYEGPWWTGIATIRVPPSLTFAFQIRVVFQYFGELHSVQHAQLSLVGWGTNGLWEQVGLGSNGEAMTYEPDPHQRRNSILDTRPFLTCRDQLTGPCSGNPDTTGWTDDHGGSDWFNAVTKHGFFQYLVNNTALHVMNGPRLTNVTYQAKTVDGNWAITRTACTWTTDAITKHLHSFEYLVQNDFVGNPYPRFSVYTLGRDSNNYSEEPHFVYGTGSVLLDNKTHVQLDPTNTLKNFDYATNYHNAVPGCSANISCWFGMLTPYNIQPDHEAHRGLIIRHYQARLNGSDTTDFTFSLMRNGNVTVPRLILEIGLPSWFVQGLEAGTAQFRQGDYIRGDIEQLLPPRESQVYYGDSQRLRQWYINANVEAHYSNAWKILSWDAQRGDSYQVVMFHGTLERKYPPRIHVASDSSARFNLANLAGDWPGILPFSITGVQLDDDFVLKKTWSIASNFRLYRWNNDKSVWEVFGMGADGSTDFQLDREPSDGTFTFTYSLLLEWDDVQPCEEFAFARGPPDITNSLVCP